MVEGRGQLGGYMESTWWDILNIMESLYIIYGDENSSGYSTRRSKDVKPSFRCWKLYVHNAVHSGRMTFITN